MSPYFRALIFSTCLCGIKGKLEARVNGTARPTPIPPLVRCEYTNTDGMLPVRRAEDEEVVEGDGALEDIAGVGTNRRN